MSSLEKEINFKGCSWTKSTWIVNTKVLDNKMTPKS